VLVFNAAIYPPDPPSRLAPAELEASFAVNVAGALVAVQAVLEALREQRGTVLLTGGGAALHPTASFAALGVTKAALRALAYALHEDLRPTGVHVATVTINGLIGSNDAMAPDRIADRYWAIHTRPEAQWEAEEAYP
jgi:NAD(P)-dependent dehydrogenase (short-subunit alcohol dehydrogenase family)